MYACRYVCRYACMYACMHVCMYVFKTVVCNECIYANIYYIRLYIHCITYMQSCARSWTHCISTDLHTYITNTHRTWPFTCTCKCIVCMRSVRTCIAYMHALHKTQIQIASFACKHKQLRSYTYIYIYYFVFCTSHTRYTHSNICT